MRTATRAILLAVVLMTGCQRLGIYNQDDIDQRDDQIAALEEKLQSAKGHADELEIRQVDLQSASDDLQSNVERLQYENWRDVVPDIEDSSATVDSYQEDAASSADELSASLEQ